MLRYLTAGESHGKALVTIIEGLPAGLPVTVDYIDRQLKRRQAGYGRGGRMKIEHDRVQILAGVRGGVSLGSPVALLIENQDWTNWADVMASEPEAKIGERVVTRPRPGHADLAGALKYGHHDLRNVLERASARETAARVAAGTVARRLLEELGVDIVGMVRRVGDETGEVPDKSPDELRARVETSSIMCPDPHDSWHMMNAIDLARDTGDTLGGVFEVRAYGVPVGLGSHVHWDRKLDARLARALMSIQAVKGVEVGDGFAAAASPGSAVGDEIFYGDEQGLYRTSNHAGGIEGGITNGQPVVVRAAMKPIPTLHRPLASVDLKTRESVEAAYERSDVCAVPAASVIGEAVVAWELAVACLEKFSGDSLDEVRESLDRYQARLASFVS